MDHYPNLVPVFRIVINKKTVTIYIRLGTAYTTNIVRIVVNSNTFASYTKLGTVYKTNIVRVGNSSVTI
jgi:hypothetical protein